ncbi:hypothetical protein Bca4012_054282 [Brassica carinata]
MIYAFGWYPRREALQECIGKPPRKGPKTLNKKRSYTQFHLDLGQSDFLLRRCVECGATYAPGDDLDEKSHQSFHKEYMNGIPFKLTVGRTREPSHRLLWARTVLLWYWKLILLRIETRFILFHSLSCAGSCNGSSFRGSNVALHLKVQEVVKMMEVELGEDWILHKHCKVYLLVSSQRISGCLVAEPIKEAFKLIAPFDDKRQLKKESSSPSTTIHFGNIVLQREASKRCRESDDRLDNRAIVCEEEAKPAVCGVRAIWVSPSNRRKGLATQLLDTARERFSSGCVLEKSQLAFSQPSSLGRAFGSNYFGTSSFLVYKAQLSVQGPIP